jgi:hypothetical protein
MPEECKSYRTSSINEISGNKPGREKYGRKKRNLFTL